MMFVLHISVHPYYIIPLPERGRLSHQPGRLLVRLSIGVPSFFFFACSAPRRSSLVCLSAPQSEIRIGLSDGCHACISSPLCRKRGEKSLAVTSNAIRLPWMQLPISEQAANEEP